MPAIEIAVMKPPDMFQEIDRIRFLKVLEEFENTICSAGRHTTEFWYFVYRHFINDLGFGDQSWDILKNNKKVDSYSLTVNPAFLILQMRMQSIEI